MGVTKERELLEKLRGLVMEKEPGQRIKYVKDLAEELNEIIKEMEKEDKPN